MYPYYFYVVLYGLCFIVGAVFGSFLACLARRMTSDKSVLMGRSACDSCGKTLGLLDLVPVFSFLFLRGRCRYCRKPIPLRDFITELFCGAAVVLILAFGGFDDTWQTMRYILLVFILVPLSLVDLDSFIIPDRFILAGTALGAVYLPFFGWEYAKSRLIGAFGVAIPLLLLVLLMNKLLKKDTMGGGDIKLFFVIGLNLGIGLTLFTLILSCFVGLLFSLAVRSGKSKPFPFAPSVAFSAFIAMLVGEGFVNWYVSLFHSF